MKIKLLLFLMCTLPLNSLIVSPPTDPRLNQVSTPLSVEEIQSQQIQNLICQMLQFSGGEADPNQYEKGSVLAGLAAPQVGVMKQIVLINTSCTKEKLRQKAAPAFDVLINPKVTFCSEETSLSLEGCYSVPEKYIGKAYRPIHIKVEALDQNGKQFVKEYFNETAHIAHHEIDHLNGVRFPQRLASNQDLLILDSKADFRKFKNNKSLWDKTASSELFKEMKSGNYQNAD